MDWIYYILMLVVGFFGVFINILGLPGNWILVLAVGVYAWATGFERHVGWAALVSLVVIGLIGELVEFLAGGAGAAKAGGTKRGMIGALVGGFIGALFLSIPVPIAGTIIGACAGAFIGAFLVEYAIEPDHERSLKIGIGAAKGRLFGIVSKLAFGFIMLIVAFWTALPTGAPLPAAVAPPATAPTTTPVITPTDSDDATVENPATLQVER